MTGITADEDVDARDDSPSRTVQRQPSRSAGSRQPERAAARSQTSPSAQAVAPRAAGSAAATPSVAGAGGDLPPLPGEGDAPGPAPQGQPAGNEPAAGPGAPGDERHRKLVGAVQGQFKRLEFTDDDRDQRLEVAAVLAKIGQISSLNEMTHDELSDVAGTLSRLRNRDALTAHLVARDKVTAGEPGGK